MFLQLSFFPRSDKILCYRYHGESCSFRLLLCQHKHTLGGSSLQAQDVERMIAAAMECRFPKAEVTNKTCSKCGQSFARAMFAPTQWVSSNPECKTCHPIDPQLQKRSKDGKACCECKVVKDKAQYSTTQWASGAKAKCRDCVAKLELSQKTRSKTCVTCHQAKPQNAYSKTQWERPQKQGSQCKECCTAALSKRHEDFREECSKQAGLRRFEWMLPVSGYFN